MCLKKSGCLVFQENVNVEREYAIRPFFLTLKVSGKILTPLSFEGSLKI